MAQKGGPCYRGQRLLDNAPCQAVAGLDSGALPFPGHRALLVQTKADRHAKGSPSGRAGERSETERASPGQKSFCAAISRFFVRAILSLCFYISVSILALSVTFGDTARVAAPSVCFAAARILLAAAPTAPPCFRRWRRSSPLLPKGEPLAGRATSYWTPEARCGAKARASLTGPAASGQRTLSSCREFWQQRTTVSGTSCFARPDES